MHIAVPRVFFLGLLLALVTATKVNFIVKLSKSNVDPGERFALTVTLPKNSPCHHVHPRCQKHPHSPGCPVDNAICTLQLHVPDGAAYVNHTSPLKAKVYRQADFSSIVEIPIPPDVPPVSRRNSGRSDAVLTHKIDLLADACLPANKLSFRAAIKIMQKRTMKTTTKKKFQVQHS